MTKKYIKEKVLLASKKNSSVSERATPI